MRKMYSENQVKEIIKEAMESGEISGGTQLYKHYLSLGFDIINNNTDRIDNLPTLASAVNSALALINYNDAGTNYIVMHGQFVGSKTILTLMKTTDGTFSTLEVKTAPTDTQSVL